MPDNNSCPEVMPYRHCFGSWPIKQLVQRELSRTDGWSSSTINAEILSESGLLSAWIEVREHIALPDKENHHANQPDNYDRGL